MITHTHEFIARFRARFVVAAANEIVSLSLPLCFEWLQFCLNDFFFETQRAPVVTTFRVDNVWSWTKRMVSCTATPSSTSFSHSPTFTAWCSSPCGTSESHLKITRNTLWHRHITVFTFKTQRIWSSQLWDELAIGVGEDGVELGMHLSLSPHPLPPHVPPPSRLLTRALVHSATWSESAAR